MGSFSSLGERADYADRERAFSRALSSLSAKHYTTPRRDGMESRPKDADAAHRRSLR
jgi:hypothetical protein